MPLIRLAGVRRDFGTGEATVAALDGADLVIEAGEMVAIVGQSGSGANISASSSSATTCSPS